MVIQAAFLYRGIQPESELTTAGFGIGTRIKVMGSLRADTRTVYLIKRYFIVFLSPKTKPCDPTWTWKAVLK